MPGIEGQWDYAQEEHRIVGNLLLEGSCADSLAPGPSTKTPIWKAPKPYVKKIHLLILKYLPEKQENVGTFSRNINTDGDHICNLILLDKCWRW